MSLCPEGGPCLTPTSGQEAQLDQRRGLWKPSWCGQSVRKGFPRRHSGGEWEPRQEVALRGEWDGGHLLPGPQVPKMGNKAPRAQAEWGANMPRRRRRYMNEAQEAHEP